MALSTSVLTAGFNSTAATITPVSAPAANQSILIRGLCFTTGAVATVLTINSQLSGMGFGPFTFPAAGGILVLPDLMPTEEVDPYYTIIAAGTALVIANSGTSAPVSGYVRYSIA